MHADLDLLLIAVFCTADDLLPRGRGNARRRVTDAEVVTLCVAQAVMGITSDRRFLAVAGRRLSHLFPELPQQPGYHKRRRRLAETIDWLCAVFARECPGFYDDLVLLDSAPVECGRSAETARRSALADACGYGYCRSHSRFFWGRRLHGVFAPDGTPRALTHQPADRPEREVALELLPRALRGGEAVVCDKGYASREFERQVGALGALVLRPARRNEPDNGLHLSSIRQRIESVFQTCKDILTLERHAARTLPNLRARIAQRILALASCLYVNPLAARSPPRPLRRHELGPQGGQAVPLVCQAEPGEQLVGEREVVGPQVGGVVEDRHPALGRLGVAHRTPDHRAEDLLAEPLPELAQGVARVHQPHVCDVQQHPEPVELGTQVVLRQLDDLERLLDPLQREVLGLARDHGVVGGHQGVDRQKPE